MTDKINPLMRYTLTALLLLCVGSWLMWNDITTTVSSVISDTSVRRALQRVSNKVTFLYVVGVEGVGHHGVTPALATIGRSCQNFVYYESKYLRSQQSRMLSTHYHNSLVRVKETRVPSKTNEILIIEDGSFPTDNLLRNSSHEAKKTAGMYNLEWVYDNAKLADLNIKFLYLNRDFYRSVVSHPELDGGYQNHAQVLSDFMGFINEEYQRIDAKESGLWRQIDYEWFTPLENCTNLVSSLIDFIGWSECDVGLACRILQQDLHPPTQRVVDETILAYTQQFNTTLPIPMLNLTAGGERVVHEQRPRLTQATDDPSVEPWYLRVRGQSPADAPGITHRATRNRISASNQQNV